MLLKGVAEVQGAGRPISAAEMVLVRIAYAADLPTPDEVIRTLRQGEGKQWDATLVERFLRLVEESDGASLPEARTAG